MTTSTTAPAPKGPDEMLLAWTQQDIENRIGFKGGRFTDVNNACAILGAVLFTAAAYLLATFVFKDLKWTASAAETFLRSGNQITVIPGTFLFTWGLAVLLLKHYKLKYQEKALKLAAVPDQPEFVLTETTATSVLTRIHTLVDHPRHFVLLNRIDRALSNLKNIGQVNDVSSILRAQAENDEDQVASSYTLLNGFVWAIPVLGFIGTVQGLSHAMGRFGGTLQAAADLSIIRTSLQGVTGGLANAFETTLVALIYALLLQLLVSFQQKREMTFLDECNDYCHSHLVSKLRLIDRKQP